jgi:hypothetical protein
MNKLKILIPLFFLNFSFIQAQIHIYAGPGIGKLQYYQGPSETRAFIFNNSPNVTKEMKPNKQFNCKDIGLVGYAGIWSFGLEWNSKKNSFSGTRSDGVSDEIIEQMHSFYFNLGMGNKVDRDNDKQILWRVQAAYGSLNFKLKENLQGTTADYDGVLGETKGGTIRGSVSVLIPVFKSFSISIVPYYERLDDRYVYILEDRIMKSETFNITNYGINLNLDYEF